MLESVCWLSTNHKNTNKALDLKFPIYVKKSTIKNLIANEIKRSYIQKHRLGLANPFFIPGIIKMNNKLVFIIKTKIH